MKRIILFLLLLPSIVFAQSQLARKDTVKAYIADSLNNRLGANWYTPQMYSFAFGTAPATQQTAVSNMLTAIGSENANVFFPQGTYDFNTTVTFPKNVNLIMPKGALFADSVVINGNIEAGNYKIFNGGAGLSGAKINGVQAEWFGAIGDSTDATSDINQAIQSLGTVGGDVYIGAGTFLVDAENTSINMASNVNLRMSNNTTLQAITSTSGSYEIIKAIRVSNIGIYGGNIRGERTSHVGVIDDFGMGIYLIKVDNAIIKDVYISNCWGDGIYISDDKNEGGYATNRASTNVTIDRVVSYNNRRQGLSAIHWYGGSITNSSFLSTNGTTPAAGIDFEPNLIDSQYITGVTVTGNIFNDNDGFGIQLENLKGYRNFIYNNYFEDNVLGKIGTDGREQTSLIFGEGSAYYLNENTYGNTFIGTMAGRDATTALRNTAIGDSAGYNLTLGDRNIIIGSFGSSGGITTGNDNIIIGHDVRYSTNPAYNTQLNIGNIIYGFGIATGDTLATGKIGIKSPYPAYDLHVEGVTQSDSIRIGDNIYYADGHLAITVPSQVNTKWDFGFDRPTYDPLDVKPLGRLYFQSDSSGYEFSFGKKDTNGTYYEIMKLDDYGDVTMTNDLTIGGNFDPGTLGTFESTTGRIGTPNHPNESLDSNYTRIEKLDKTLFAFGISDATGTDYSTAVFNDSALTISKIYVVLRTDGGGNDTADVNIYWASDISGSTSTALTSDTSITNVSTGTTITSIDDATIPAGVWVWTQCNREVGTVSQINITVRGKLD